MGFRRKLRPTCCRAPTELTRRKAWGQGAARGVSFISAKTLTATVNVAAKNERKESKTSRVGLLGDVWDYKKGSLHWNSLGVFVIIASSQGFLSLLIANLHSLKIFAVLL